MNKAEHDFNYGRDDTFDPNTERDKAVRKLLWVVRHYQLYLTRMTTSDYPENAKRVDAAVAAVREFYPEEKS